LACAFYLQQAGYACTVYDDHEHPGGRLREDVPEADLPRDVLDAEIELITRMGVQFQGNTHVGGDMPLAELQARFDAVYIATGRDEDTRQELGLPTGPKGFKVDRHTHQTPEAAVFAGGDAVRGPSQRAIRSLADGREAAISIGQYLAGKEVAGPEQPFNIRMGRLEADELKSCMALASHDGRQSPESLEQGFSSDQARDEALRCLHCDCRKPRACKLRHYSQIYGAQTSQYKAERRTFSQSIQHPELIYEPGKCIACGLCIKITAREAEDLGLTFVGRGFDIRVAVPLDRTMNEALQKTVQACTQACPTGALVLRDA
jgi:ferredoxin